MDDTQHGNGWSGLLVLSGKFDISPIYRQMLADQHAAFSVVYGDAQHGKVEFKDSTPEQYKEMLAQIGMKFPIQPFSLIIIGDSPEITNLPTRDATVGVWSQGHIDGGFQKPADLLIHLNREVFPQKINYTRVLRERVIEPLQGKFAMCIGYFSRHPRLVLATQNMELYTWIMYYNDVYMFVWSTDLLFVDRIKKSLAYERRNELFALSIHLDNRSMIVIHPMYWISKFNKVLKLLPGRDSRLLITSYFRNYLLRQSITRHTAMDADVFNLNTEQEKEMP